MECRYGNFKKITFKVQPFSKEKIYTGTILQHKPYGASNIYDVRTDTGSIYYVYEEDIVSCD